ncbi:DNA/RNA non-specific endonuclease [uncultured Flavobacterium sp.]|uniref:DNA/RNA non-specific endonuclease n=1 Tax=uncultured Flavobacterium sp. TaxID=165435 RepID=UPI0030CA3310|tara:strand:+ start:440 stop:1189 length:750 start_codon:yes stop_codon:yes gene_type:complete
MHFLSCKDKASNQNDIYSFEKTSVDHTLFDYLPSSTSNDVYTNDSYSFSYKEIYEQSEWVAYELTSSDMNNAHYQRPYFNQDNSVKSKSADWKNYKNSGYNKGHLCPAADRKSSYNMYKQTFLTSNISPQISDFNAGIWNRLEQKTRYWATRYGGLYVITGGVLKKGLKTIGKENVAVPTYFYKIILTKDKLNMIAFLVPHEASNASLYSFVVSVDEIEKMTGIDFFKALPDDLENSLEGNKGYKNWSF